VSVATVPPRHYAAAAETEGLREPTRLQENELGRLAELFESVGVTCFPRGTVRARCFYGAVRVCTVYITNDGECSIA
jgi:hypothetical protein